MTTCLAKFDRYNAYIVSVEEAMAQRQLEGDRGIHVAQSRRQQRTRSRRPRFVWGCFSEAVLSSRCIRSLPEAIQKCRLSVPSPRALGHSCGAGGFRMPISRTQGGGQQGRSQLGGHRLLGVSLAVAQSDADDAMPILLAVAGHDAVLTQNAVI